MTLPQNVKDAVVYVDGGFDDCDNVEWRAIRAHLLNQDAEIDRLTCGNISYAQENVNLIGREHVAVKRAELAESRLAAANALLRYVSRYLNPRHYPEAIKRIDAHLQGAGDETV